MNINVAIKSTFGLLNLIIVVKKAINISISSVCLCCTLASGLSEYVIAYILMVS